MPYGPIQDTFWTRGSGRELRGDHVAQLVALYLMTCKSANMIGLYYLAIPTMAHEIGCPLEGASKALQRVCEGGIATLDKGSEVVFVRTMARRRLALEPGEDLKPGDNRIKRIITLMRECGSTLLLQEFWNEYHDTFHLPEPWWTSPFEGPSEPLGKPLRSQEQDQYQEKESISSTSSPAPLLDLGPEPETRSEAERVFDHWRATHQPKAKQTAKRLGRIQARLKEGFSFQDLCSAISGALADDWIMGRDPKARPGGWRDLDTILRDAAQVERLSALAEEPAPQVEYLDTRPRKSDALGVLALLEGGRNA